MGLVLVTPPVVEPVTLAEAKLYLRVETDDEDVLISALIKAIRESVENYTERSLINQTWRLSLDSYGDDRYLTQFLRGELRLPRPPVSSISSFQYTDPNGVVTTMPVANYQFNSERQPATVARVYGVPWPVSFVGGNVVQLTYVAGYGATGASVPQSLRLALLMRLAHYYENRGAETTGTTIAQFNRTEELLMDPYRVLEM